MARFEGTSFLLCALGDGSLHYYLLDKHTGNTSLTKDISAPNSGSHAMVGLMPLGALSIC